MTSFRRLVIIMLYRNTVTVVQREPVCPTSLPTMEKRQAVYDKYSFIVTDCLECC